ncbi:polysaccharide biosynthesis/export family protein [Parendozoicomonas sp. Alg238-R29]|uniref:polysaccharide biosynthesis/export family protein n=1 Tax=Parendozoicomonas sp. Alg238-R29 TaxID=2993446 RepID=UPI00248D75C3|nr:polysaccharide biosynthesis/export family protein [Parendozoicomonas sp. Alg238-R29]
MTGFSRFLAGFLWLAIVLAAGARAEDTVSYSTYRLNAGDMVSINVFGEEDLSVETRLTDAGTISYPFLGEVRVKGLTVGQLENLVTSKLKGDYLIDPKVNVTITEYRKFFVRGEVKDPGGFSFEPGLSLEKAIALAGGFTERASRKQVAVTREVNGTKKTVTMNLDRPVMPGDIVNVKESFF